MTNKVEEDEEVLKDRATSLMFEAEGYRAQMKSLQGGVEHHENQLQARRAEVSKLRVDAEINSAKRMDAELKARVIRGEPGAKEELQKTLAALKKEVETMSNQLAKDEETLKQLSDAYNKSERSLLSFCFIFSLPFCSYMCILCFMLVVLFAGIAILQDDRITLTRDYNRMMEQETALADEGKRIMEEIARIAGENAELKGALASDSVISRKKAVQLTRTAEQINLDASFLSKFPSLPKDEYLVDWFGCATVANPGWIYIGTHYICWEAAINPLMNKVVIPIECIRRLNKIQSSYVLQAMMFEVFVDAEKPPTTKLLDGSTLKSVLSVPLQKHYTFRSANWQNLFSTIARQAQMLPHKLMISVNGKDDYALQLGVVQ